MTRTAVTQIVIATASTVIAGMILDYMKRQNQPAPPIADDSNNTWFKGLF